MMTNRRRGERSTVPAPMLRDEETTGDRPLVAGLNMAARDVAAYRWPRPVRARAMTAPMEVVS